MIKEIMAVLAQVEKDGPAGFVVNADPKEKSAVIMGEWLQWLERMKLNERKRNERRLRELRRAFQKDGDVSLVEDLPHNVVEFPATQGAQSDATYSRQVG